MIINLKITLIMIWIYFKNDIFKECFICISQESFLLWFFLLLFFNRLSLHCMIVWPKIYSPWTKNWYVMKRGKHLQTKRDNREMLVLNVNDVIQFNLNNKTLRSVCMPIFHNFGIDEFGWFIFCGIVVKA